jgi:hypothetical protein
VHTVARYRIKSLWHRVRSLAALDFVFLILPYFLNRIYVVLVYLATTFELLLARGDVLKKSLVSRLFWGRGGLYKSLFHILITIFTFTFVLAGVLDRVRASEQKEQALSVSYGVSGNSDLLEQGGSLTTVLAINVAQVNYVVHEHVVVEILSGGLTVGF